MTAPRDFVLVARRPALDLCNTRLCEKDLLIDTDDLARWLVEAGLATRRPPVSRDELAAVRGLRDALRPALLDADGPALAALAEAWFDDAPGRLCVEPDTLQPRFSPGESTCRCLMVAALLDALDLVRDLPGRVRECADPGCPVVYLDESRNRSRRWCSMDSCGARAKAATYYRRHRASR